MLTITLTATPLTGTLDGEAARAIATSAFVVADPHHDDLVHAHGGCVELSTVVDLVECLTDRATDDPDVFDGALADLGLVLPLEEAVGLRACPSCWSPS